MVVYVEPDVNTSQPSPPSGSEVDQQYIQWNPCVSKYDDFWVQGFINSRPEFTGFGIIVRKTDDSTGNFMIGI